MVPKEREVERRREVREWEGRVCARAEIGAPSMLRLIRRDTQGRGLGEDLADLRCEQEVKGSTAEAERGLCCALRDSSDRP